MRGVKIILNFPHKHNMGAGRRRAGLLWQGRIRMVETEASRGMSQTRR